MRRRRLAKLAKGINNAISPPSATSPITPMTAMASAETPVMQVINPLTNRTALIPSPGLAGPNPSQPMESNTQLDLQNQHAASFNATVKTGIKTDSLIVTDKSNSSNIIDEIPDSKMSDLSQSERCNRDVNVLSCDASLACQNLPHPMSMVSQNDDSIRSVDVDAVSSNEFSLNTSVDMSSPVKTNETFMQPSVAHDGSNSSINGNKFTRESSISMDIDETLQSERCSLRESDSGTETMEVNVLKCINFSCKDIVF